MTVFVAGDDAVVDGVAGVKVDGLQRQQLRAHVAAARHVAAATDVTELRPVVVDVAHRHRH